MAKRRGLEQQLAELKALRADPTSIESLEKLRQALAGKTNHLVAAAARFVSNYEIEPLEPELVAAFKRFLINPVKSDPGCAAKLALAEALYKMGRRQEEVFLQGIRHVQLEPVYGGKEDTAPGLRGVCALGLIRSGYPEVMVELAHLLADPEVEARLGAVRAIAYSGQTAGVPLLRFKVLVGDEDGRVPYECFGALLKLSPEGSLPFVAEFLDNDEPATSEGAALALGESRQAEAFAYLRASWDRTVKPEQRQILLTAMALLRTEPALEFLLSLVAEGAAAMAQAAVAALEMYQGDTQLWSRLERLVAARGDIDLD